MNDPIPPPEVLEATPEHLHKSLRKCRCGKWFCPLERARKCCVPCTKQDSNDALLIKMAFGKAYR